MKKTTLLNNGTRKLKNDIIFKCLGDLDELNCNLAMAKVICTEENISEKIDSIQNKIMEISAFVATPPYDSTTKIKNMELHLEEWNENVGFENTLSIDKCNKSTKSKIENKFSAQIHICRAITRRCERSFIDLYTSCDYLNVYGIIDYNINNIADYLNMLSDYLLII